MTIDSDYETWGGGEWNLSLNSTDYSANLTKAKFTEGLNEPIQFKVDLEGIDSDNVDMNDGNIAELDYGGTKAFKGRIVDSETSSDLTHGIEGIGMSFDLVRRTFTKNYSDSNSDTITTEVVGSTMNIGTNTRLNSTAGAVDFRMDEEQKLVGLNRLAGQYGGEWWVDEDANGNDQFNIDTQRGGGTSVKTFKVSGDDKNAEVAKKNTSAGEGNYDGVVVKGYGDGDDQIVATAGVTGDEDQVIEFTDKRITSQRAAQDKADEIKTVRVDGDWTEITIIPGDPNQILDVGDTVTVESSDADIANTDYRIVERTYTVDLQGEIEAELVCNNRPSTIFEGGLAETREETKSQTRNMQGSRNVWGEKESANASNTEPLTIDFYIPPDVNDLTGKNRTNSIKLNYTTAPYRQDANTVSAQTVDNTDDFREDRVDDTDRDRQDRVDDVPSTAITVEKGDVNDEAHDVASVTSDAINNSSLSGASDDSFQSEAINSSGYDFITNVSASSDALAHLLSVQVTDIDSTTNLDFVVSTGGTVRMKWQARDVGANDASQIAAIDFSNYMVETGLVSMTGFSGGNTITYDLYVASQGGGAPTCDFEIRVTELNHEHNIPVNGNGVDLFDSGSANRLPLEKDDGTNFDSSSTSETKQLTVETQSDTKQNTVESTSDTKSDRVSQVNNDVAAGAEASDVSVLVDGTNIDGAGNTRGTNQDQEIDITSTLTDSDGDGKPDVGWHTVKIAPEPAGQVSFMKGRVFLDHHKDSTN